jgi:endonuclease III
MKFDAEHIRRLKKLWTQLKKESGASPPDPMENPMDALLEGVFATYAAESRAHSAVSRLRSAVVDLNELRVTPVAEMVEIIGPDFPMCRPAAEEASRALTSLFNRTHSMDMMFLKKQTRRGAETFLNRLDGLGFHAKAYILLRCFKAPIIPVDYHMLHFLRKAGIVPIEAGWEDVQKFLMTHIRESEMPSFYTHLKRHASVHAPRKPVEHVPPPAAEPMKDAVKPGAESEKKPVAHARPHPPAKSMVAKKVHPAKPPKKRNAVPGSKSKKR